MAVRPRNRFFTNPGSFRPTVQSVGSFDQVVEALHLSPSDYLGSPELKEWVRRNKDQRYVPTELLEAFGFVVE